MQLHRILRLTACAQSGLQVFLLELFVRFVAEPEEKRKEKNTSCWNDGPSLLNQAEAFRGPRPLYAIPVAYLHFGILSQKKKHFTSANLWQSSPLALAVWHGPRRGGLGFLLPWTAWR